MKVLGFTKGRERVAGARCLLAGAMVLAVAVGLSACSGGGSVAIADSQSPDPATVDFPIFYVKRTIPPTTDDLRMLRTAVLPMANVTLVPQANLFKRDTASPSANETNITARITGTDSYDVKDVDASPDGKTIVFAMRGPLKMNMKQKDAPSWRIWTYDIASDNLHVVVDPTTDPDPATSNDVAPHVMPDGRIVFSSTRQRQSKAVLLDESKPQFEAQDEARNEPAFVLHVMNADGTEIHQISFNQSHDRDSTILSSGRVLWSRWDHAPGKDGMHLYTSNPDGTDVQLYYGANSHNTGSNNSVIEFVKPREMQNGSILALMRPYTDVDFGGDLVIIDGTRYVENTQALLANAGLAGPAQTRATPNDVRTVPGPSPGGRFNSAYALWDGTNRILVSWSQCRLLDATQMPPAIVPCTDARDADPAVQTAPPLYSVWMFDPAQNTLLPVMPPVENVMVTDIVAAQPRTLPNIILDKIPGLDLDQDLVSQSVGVIDIKSVYDFDGRDTAIPNIATVADPSKTTAAQRAARFVRLEKPVSIPDKDVVDLAGAAFGASGFMREIMGYAPVQPDGSVRIEVPANVAFQISVLDVNGRRISPVHSSWLQVKPGEVLTCNGCHAPATAQKPLSHGRSGVFAAAYSGSAAGGVFPNANPALTANAGETMAEALARMSCASDTPHCKQMLASVNLSSTEIWANPPAATPDVSIRYQDLPPGGAIPTSLGCTSTWAENCRIVINYPKFVQVLWDLPRQTINPTTMAVISDHTCTQGGCHSTTPAAGSTATVQVPAGQLNLTNTASDEEPLQPISYRHLLFQHNTQIVNMGALQDEPGPLDANGDPTTIPVGPYLNAGGANGALSSAFLGRFAPGSTSTHAGWMNPAELRLISEWLDIGAQFFNNPFDPDVPVN